MDCPGCRQPMAAETLDGHYGRTVTVDLCYGCGALWLDGLESLTLTPGATLRLFTLIHDHRAARRAGPAPAPTCPRCEAPLVQTADVQRATPFNYARCPREHGRFITFFDFLREKHFVRPLGPAEIEALRQHVRTVHCSGCGAPVDVGRASVCSFCGAPLSTLDAGQVERLVQDLKRAEEKRRTVDPTWPVQIMLDRVRVERAFAQFESRPVWLGLDGASGLVEAGLEAFLHLLRGEG
jgi:hypothetical protein